MIYISKTIVEKLQDTTQPVPTKTAMDLDSLNHRCDLGSHLSDPLGLVRANGPVDPRFSPDRQGTHLHILPQI